MDNIEGELIVEFRDDQLVYINHGDEAVAAAEALIMMLEEADNISEQAAEADGQPSIPDEVAPQILPTRQSLSDQNRAEIQKAKKTNLGRKENQILRILGKEYSGLHKQADGKKVVVARGARVLGQRCQSAACQKSTTRHCSKIIEVERQEIFDKFWTMTPNGKSSHLKSMVDMEETKTQNIVTIKPRKWQWSYFLRFKRTRKQVCLRMFLATYGLNESQMRRLVLDENTKADPILVLRAAPSNKENSIDVVRAKQFVRDFLTKLPKLPSHFSRATSDKLYLQNEDLFQSMRGVWRFCVEESKDAGVKDVSWTVFRTIFHDMKLSVHPLKKDCCDDCTLYSEGEMTEQEFENHRLRVEEARNEKKSDKKKKKNSEGKPNLRVLIVVVDLQKILQCPHLFNSLQYYLSKLALRNYTIYDLLTKKVVCKLWDETEGGMDSSVFASLLCSYLESRLSEQPEIEEIIVWSDGCPAQNRNIVLSNALVNFVVTKEVTVVQKYFVKGHSQNEADSVHARIESAVSGRKIYNPKMYVSVIANARMPSDDTDNYVVDVVSHKDFKNYKNVKYYDSIRPGMAAHDDTVNMIRCLKYTPDGTIQYKLNFTDPWSDMLHRVTRPTANITSKYRARTRITKSKYDDLQSLQKFISKKSKYYNLYKDFYTSLPHK